MTPIQVGDEVERFNERHPAGTPVRYWPGVRQGEGRESVTRTPAWLVSGKPCVSVEGYPGGIALTHVEVRDSIQLRDIVSFRENESTAGAGHVTRVWDKPKADPYVTISSEGRTFVRLSSAVTVTRKAER